MQWYYVANARMPSEKAHGIQIAKMCEALVEAGVAVVLVVPWRFGEKTTLKTFYGLRVDVPIIRLPSIDLYARGRVGYYVSSLFFMMVSFLFLFSKKMRGEKCIVYTVDLDNFSSSGLAYLGLPLFSEMHGGKPVVLAQKVLFRSVRGIIAINKHIIAELQKKFPLSPARYLVEPNGVDATQFYPRDKTAARQELTIPFDQAVVLYTGRFFAWKGLESLAEAAALTPNTSWYIVGGTRESFCRVIHTDTAPDNMIFMGDQPYATMPTWIAAADALVVLGTKRDMQSYWYTSPMKLFEYLLSGRPIVASATPAIQEIVSDREVFLYEPDNAQDLARQISAALAESAQGAERIVQAERLGRNFSWQARAARVAAFVGK